jgi:hypothetical protein
MTKKLFNKLLFKLSLLAMFIITMTFNLEAANRHMPPRDVPELDPSSAITALSALGFACVLLRKRNRAR